MEEVCAMTVAQCSSKPTVRPKLISDSRFTQCQAIERFVGAFRASKKVCSDPFNI